MFFFSELEENTPGTKLDPHVTPGRRIVPRPDCWKASGYPAGSLPAPPTTRLKTLRHVSIPTYMNSVFFSRRKKIQQNRKEAVEGTIQWSKGKRYPKESSFSVVFSSESVSMAAKVSKSSPIL